MYAQRSVRSVIRTSGKSLFTILYNDEQMADIKSLCCAGCTILEVDKTLNLWDMHVTVTCFKQLSVTKILLDNSPVFIGPVFLTIILILKVTVSFYHLKMKLVDTDLSKLVKGTDEEAAIVKAIFGNSIFTI